MDKEFKITSAKQYEDIMIEVFELQEQEEPLTSAQLSHIKLMLAAAERYENDVL